MSTATKFQVGDTLRSLTDEQHLEKGCLYTVIEVNAQVYPFGTFVTYMVRDAALDREWPVRNAHLLMERAT